MTNAIYFGYGFPATYQAYDPRANTLVDDFFRLLRQVIESDPFFSNPLLTGNQLLDYLEYFLDRGGKPTLLIPELRIGTSNAKNMSCLELVYRIYHCDFNGLRVLWDNEGVPINQRFNKMIRRCLAMIDRISEDANLSADEIVVLIECVQAADPYLSNAKETGYRILTLMDKFLRRNGNPLVSILNVKIGHERSDKLTLLELVYLLWKHPYGIELEIEEWKDEDETIEGRFESIVNRCLQIIDQKLRENQVRDEDFLPLIRCVIEFSDGNEKLSEKTGGKFLYLMNYFVFRRVNPNLFFVKIQIEGNVYTHVTCFQVTYLVWKSSRVIWNDSYEREFRRLIEAMLSDRRIDLTLRFSERSLNAHHFVNSQNIEFYQRQHDTTRKKFYSNGRYEPDARVIDRLHGHSLERMTIAHCAALLNDYVMLDQFLDREPRLRDMTCCMTRGKATIMIDSKAIHPFQDPPPLLNILDEDDQVSGSLTVVDERNPRAVDIPWHRIQVIRTTRITLLHLAARAGHEGVLACLRNRHPNPALTDSQQQTPQDYLRLSVMEGVVAKDLRSLGMLKALDLTVRVNSSFALPEVNRLIRHEAYDLLYNTSRKVAIFAFQRLGKDSFGNARRTNHKWIENLEIPELNRAKDDDFKYSGFDRGHLVPAEDATGSDKKMASTFKLENAVPENLSLNRGAWSRLEVHVRNLVYSNDLVEVITGPLFLPEPQGRGRVITHGLIGRGDVHVPTHLFKVIFKHSRETTGEVYILPNHELPAGRKFSDYRCDDKLNFIQQYSGILFNQWIRR